MSPRVAVVGAGPSGFYACKALLGSGLRVDLFERLPVPFGLLRFGVAPDHASIKRIARLYERIAAHERLRFVGGIEVGEQVSVEQLGSAYSAVIWAMGAPLGRRLVLPGGDLPGVFPASELAYWSNGHPDAAQLDLGLQGVTRALVVGNGDVALDMARLLGRDPRHLETTDMPEAALDQLRGSGLRQVVVLGRRGPEQVAWAPRMLAELGRVEGLRVWSRWPLPGVAGSANGAERHVELRFLGSPVEVLGRDRVEAVRIARNELVQEGSRLRAVRTPSEHVEPFELVVQSIGYQAIPIDGLPMRRGRIPHREGRVEGLPGHYLVGWAKRGAQGVIGTNKPDAEAVVATVLRDLAHLPSASSELDLASLGGLSWSDWERLDAEELRRGRALGKPREKFTSVEAMRAFLEV